jgi:hypothetical protein
MSQDLLLRQVIQWKLTCLIRKLQVLKEDYSKLSSSCFNNDIDELDYIADTAQAIRYLIADNKDFKNCNIESIHVSSAITLLQEEATAFLDNSTMCEQACYKNSISKLLKDFSTLNKLMVKLYYID